MNTIIMHILAFDRSLCLKVSAITGRRNLDRFMCVITKSGDGHLYAGVGIFSFILYGEKAFYFVFSALAAFAIQICIQMSVKHFFKRQRPGVSIEGIKFLVNPPDQFSFPSGHTAGAFIIATLAIFFLPVFVYPLYVWAGLMGFSRIYNGVHYPTDVIAGAILGVVAAFAGVGIAA